MVSIRSATHLALLANAEPPVDCSLCPRLAAYRQANRKKNPDWFNNPVQNFGDRNARLLIVGTGQNGVLEFSDDASDYLRKKGCTVELLPTPRAVEAWNSAEGSVIGMFHITC